MNPPKLGQHFLINKNIAERIIREFLPSKEKILEIGPGKGILTDRLIENHHGPKIWAVELDRQLAEKMADKYQDRLKIINKNILEVDLNTISPHDRLNIIGNIPFYISKDLIDWLVIFNKKINRGTLMMQREFVDKLIPRKTAKKKTPRSLIFNYFYNTKKLINIRPGSFNPSPQVYSTAFSFQRISGKKELDQRIFYHFLKACFKNRRKTLFNNLAQSYTKEIILPIFKELEINNDSRSEKLNLNDFIRIFQKLNRPV
jgi:16S rRNA (adenine1518-N6/adenine1519-N6)-dimethyltransferase